MSDHEGLGDDGEATFDARTFPAGGGDSFAQEPLKEAPLATTLELATPKPPVSISMFPTTASTPPPTPPAPEEQTLLAAGPGQGQGQGPDLLERASLLSSSLLQVSPTPAALPRSSGLLEASTSQAWAAPRASGGYGNPTPRSALGSADIRDIRLSAFTAQNPAAGRKLLEQTSAFPLSHSEMDLLHHSLPKSAIESLAERATKTAKTLVNISELKTVMTDSWLEYDQGLHLDKQHQQQQQQQRSKSPPPTASASALGHSASIQSSPWSSPPQSPPTANRSFIKGRSGFGGCPSGAAGRAPVKPEQEEVGGPPLASRRYTNPSQIIGVTHHPNFAGQKEPYGSARGEDEVHAIYEGLYKGIPSGGRLPRHGEWKSADGKAHEHSQQIKAKPEINKKSSKLMKERNPKEVFQKLHEHSQESEERKAEKWSTKQDEDKAVFTHRPEISLRAQKHPKLKDRGDVFQLLYQDHLDGQERREEEFQQSLMASSFLGPSISTRSQKLASGKEPIWQRGADDQKKREEKLQKVAEDAKKGREVPTFAPKIGRGIEPGIRETPIWDFKPEENKKLALMKKAAFEKELDGCTFSPEVCPRSTRLVRHQGAFHKRLHSHAIDRQDSEAADTLDALCDAIRARGMKAGVLLRSTAYNPFAAHRETMSAKDLCEFSGRLGLVIPLSIAKLTFRVLDLEERNGEVSIDALEAGLAAHYQSLKEESMASAAEGEDTEAAAARAFPRFSDAFEGPAEGRAKLSICNVHRRGSDFQEVVDFDCSWTRFNDFKAKAAFDEAFKYDKTRGLTDLNEIVKDYGRKPKCKESVDFITSVQNLFLNNAPGEVACANLGCGQIMLEYESFQHKHVCEYRSLTCPECRRQVAARDMPNHRVSHVCSAGRVTYDKDNLSLQIKPHILHFLPCKYGIDPPTTPTLADSGEELLRALQDVKTIHQLLGVDVEVIKHRNISRLFLDEQHQSWWYNLSLNRAQEVVDRLRQAGIPEESLLSPRIMTSEHEGLEMQLRPTGVAVDPLISIDAIPGTKVLGPKSSGAKSAPAASQARLKAPGANFLSVVGRSKAAFSVNRHQETPGPPAKSLSHAASQHQIVDGSVSFSNAMDLSPQQQDESQDSPWSLSTAASTPLLAKGRGPGASFVQMAATNSWSARR